MYRNSQNKMYTNRCIEIAKNKMYTNTCIETAKTEFDNQLVLLTFVIYVLQY